MKRWAILTGIFCLLASTALADITSTSTSVYGTTYIVKNYTSHDTDFYVDLSLGDCDSDYAASTSDATSTTLPIGGSTEQASGSTNIDLDQATHTGVAYAAAERYYTTDQVEESFTGVFGVEIVVDSGDTQNWTCTGTAKCADERIEFKRKNTALEVKRFVDNSHVSTLTILPANAGNGMVRYALTLPFTADVSNSAPFVNRVDFTSRLGNSASPEEASFVVGSVFTP